MAFHQLLLVFVQPRVNLVVRFVANRVNLRAELLAREVWILVKKRLNFIVVLIEQGSDLFALVRSEFQIFCQTV
jgi:hypothetical protein